jgi:hypothetical protein
MKRVQHVWWRQTGRAGAANLPPAIEQDLARAGKARQQIAPAQVGSNHAVGSCGVGDANVFDVIQA